MGFVGSVGHEAASSKGGAIHMKKIKIRKAGPVRLTAAACSVYGKIN